MRALILAVLPLSLFACRSEPKGERTPESAAATSAAAAASPVQPAAIGAPAPDFTLPDLDGKPVQLSSF
jgi:hypothetical protein